MSLVTISKEKAKINETLAVIAAGLTIVYLIFRYKQEPKDIPVLLMVAAGIIVFGLAIPKLGYFIHWCWYKLAQGLGFVMSKVMLTIVFYVFLFPFGILSRMANKDLLKLKKRERREESYFDEINHKYAAKDMENIW